MPYVLPHSHGADRPEPYGMSLVRFHLWPLRRYHGAQQLSLTGVSLLVVGSHDSARLTSSSVPSSPLTQSVRDVVVARENESAAEGKQPSEANTSSAEDFTPSVKGDEGNAPSRAPAALVDDGADDAGSRLLSSALPPTSRAVRNGLHTQLPPAIKPPPKSASTVAMEEFAALERKLAASAAPASVTHAAAPPPKKTPEQVAMEELAALERNLGGVAADPIGRTKQAGSRKSRLSSLTRPKEPEAEECCGNGCSKCVWIDYWEELQDWEESERQRRRDKAPP